jgi:hypothetical protein
MNLELNDVQTEVLVRELSQIVENARCPLSPRIVTLKEILGQLRPEPERQPLPPRGVRDILKAHWQRTSMFVLFVAVGSALIAAVSALFAGWNYHLQLKSNEPQLASLGADIDLRGSKRNTGDNKIALFFTDIGKRPAKQGAATLFSVNETHTRQQKLGGEVPITDAETGSNVLLPGRKGHAISGFEGDAPGLILACIIYFDDKNQLQMAFIYHAKKDKSSLEIIPLDEIERPDYGEVCN